MEKIKYNNVSISVPECWDDITLGFYDTFFSKVPETNKDKVDLVARVCGIDPELLMSWPAEIFNHIIQKISFIYEDPGVEPCSSVVIDGRVYVVNVQDKLTLGEWVDIEEVQKAGSNPLSGTLAVVLRPVGEEYQSDMFEERLNFFCECKVSTLLPVLAFFLRYNEISEAHTKMYSSLCEGLDQLQQSINTSRNRGGGIKLSRIWQEIKLWLLIKSLRYRLTKYLRSSNIQTTSTMRKRRKGNSIKKPKHEDS